SSGGEIERTDPGMRDGAAHKHGAQHVRQIEIADELSPANQQTPVLAPQHRAADERCGIALHGSERRSRSKMTPQNGNRLLKISRALKLRSSAQTWRFRSRKKDPHRDPCCRCCFDIAHLVAYDGATAEVELKVGRRLQDHPGFRFTPGMIAAVFTDRLAWVVRTVIDAS